MHGLDVLDLHFQFRFSLHHRTSDGVHWNAIAHRKITSLLLEHAAQAWGVDMTCPLRAIGEEENDTHNICSLLETGLNHLDNYHDFWVFLAIVCLYLTGQCRLTERDKEKENEMQESGQSTVELGTNDSGVFVSMWFTS